MVQKCHSYYQFHACNYMLPIWQRAFVRFLIPLEEPHLADTKHNYHTPGLDTPVLSKLSPIRLGD